MNSKSLLIIFSVLVCLIEVVALNPLMLVVENKVLLSQYVNQFPQWDVVVHTDTEEFTRHVTTDESSNNAYTIFNYSKFIETKQQRPATALRVLNLVYQKNFKSFLDFSRAQANIQETDIVIFFKVLLEPYANYNYLYDTGVDNANMAFFINRTMALAIFFYNSNQFEADVKEVTRDRFNVPELRKYHNGFKNFRGFPLKIGYSNCPPYIYHHVDGYLIGVEYKILEIVVKALNITPTLINYSTRENARIKLIKDVNTSTLHFGIGCLSNNIRRNEMVAFSAALQTEPHITLFVAAGRYKQGLVYALIAPLDTNVWICCIFTLVMLSMTIKLLKTYEFNRVNVSTLITLEILLEQSTRIPDSSNALRLGLFSWILVGLSLSSSYKSKLTAAVIMPSTREPEYLGQLLREGYHFISPAEDSTYLIELLKFSTDEVEYQVGFKIQDTKIVCEAIERALHEVSAIIEERTVIRYHLWNECYKNLTQKEVASLRRIAADTTINGHLWAMPKTAPYKNRISEILEILKSHGITHKWYGSYNLTRSVPISNSVKERGVTDPLEISDLLSSFIVLAIGCGIAFVIFMLEWQIRKKNADLHNIHLIKHCILTHTDSRSKLINLGI